MNDRVSGIAVYRKFEGGQEDSYRLVDIMDIKSDWIYDASTNSYSKTIYDYDKESPAYHIMSGVEETLEKPYLNYGLSAIVKGYMFVSKAWHPDMEDVRRYIFRSQPDNFFTFNWADDFMIMPETPIAMVNFNSRLYVWGRNALYKVDPFSMLVEDTYEGISILNKDSLVKTEYGLCFMDNNNVYIHDGNKPVSIGDSILYSSNDSVIYNTTGTDGYIKLQQGYRELVEQTVANGHKPHITYSGKYNSFLVHLSNTSDEGKILAFNINKRRWDLWDSPKPYAVTTSKDSDIIIGDGTTIYNYLSLESDEWKDYNRREWDWFSKDINFGADTQDKVFRSIKFLGTPSIYETGDAIGQYDSANSKTASVQVYVDNDLVNLTVKNKFYESIVLGGTYYPATIMDTDTQFNVYNEIVDNIMQAFIRPGHIIKVNDELMLVTDLTNYADTYNGLTVERGIMGTTAVQHNFVDADSSRVSIVSPVLKFPAGTKGKNLSIRLVKQRGYIDSIGVVYKPKSIK